jgi:PAS domain S-box-containing protein
LIRRPEEYAPSRAEPFSLGALIGFRLVIVTVLLFVAGYLEAVQEGTLRVPIFLLISATFALNLVYAILMAAAPYRVQATVQILGDLVVVTGFVYLTGVDRTGFAILYPISVLCGSVLLGRGFFFATVANVLFASVLLLVRGDIIAEEAVGQIARGPLRGLIGALIGMALSSYPVAALGQFLTRALKRAGESLDAAAGEVATLQDFNRLVVENIHSGLLVTDASDRVSFANAGVAEMLGLRRENLEHRSVDELFNWPEFRRRAQPGSETTLELEHVRREGDQRTLGLWISELPGPTPGGRLLVIRDLTEVRRLEAQALLNEKLAVAGSTAAQLAHEIRNPLGAISAATKLLSEGSIAEDQKDLLRIIAKEADRLASTVTSYLREVKTQDPAVYCDLNAVVADAVRLIEISPERRPEHTIAFTPYPKVVRVAIAEDELMQVLWNLARNGLEAMPRGGALAFTIRALDEYLEVEVADEGQGMDRRRLAQLFEPLRTSKAMGTGLGLAIAHRLVRARGGDLLISSEPARGTRVRLRLLAEALAPPVERGSARGAVA